MLLSAFASALPLLTRPPLHNLLCTVARVHRRFSTPTAVMALSPVALSPTLDVHIVPILFDNFSYLLHDKSSSTATLVDPAEPQPLLDLASQLSATVTTSLTTHHHWDHAGGNEQLAALVPGVDIIGSAYETAPAVTHRLSTDQTHSVRSSSIVVRALRTPCHTNGHLCFQVVGPSIRPAVFTGDTLFVAGCGKFFEGDAADMHTSLNTILAALPDDAFIFCGHEYTVTNLKFALSVEPNNARITDKLEWAKNNVASGIPTVPSTLADEKQTNPFMRVNEHAVKNTLQMPEANSVAVMKALRERKNSFRP